MSKSYTILGKVFCCTLTLLSACVTENSLDSENLSHTEYVSLLPSVMKTDFLLRPASGLFTDNSGTSLRLYLANLDTEIGVVNIRLTAFSNSAKNLANTLVGTRNTDLVPHYSIGPRGFSVAAQRETIRVEVFRYGMRLDDCKPSAGIVKFGCAVAVNRAMSLMDIHELEYGKNLAPAPAQLGSLPVSRLFEGKVKALPSGDN